MKCNSAGALANLDEALSGLSLPIRRNGVADSAVAGPEYFGVVDCGAGN